MNSRQKHPALLRDVFVLKTSFWRLATLALRLPSPQLGLTTVFGMRTGRAHLFFLSWRLATLALRLPSPQEGLTAVFGKRTGVTPPMNHQDRKSKVLSVFSLTTKTIQNQSLPVTLFSVSGESVCLLRDSHNSFREFCRGISTPRLNTLLCVHLVPINVVISHGPQTIPYLGVGFPLRCFQRLSVPDIATEQCRWYDSSQTRGQFISVLSY